MIKLFEKNSSPWRHFSNRKSISNLIKSCLEVKFWTLGGIIPTIHCPISPKLTLPWSIEMIVELVIILPRTFNNRSHMDWMRWKIASMIKNNVDKNTPHEHLSCYQYRIHNESRVRWVLSVYLIRYKGLKIQIRWWKHP